MTLIVTVNGSETTWMLADRRISYVGRPPKDDARKLLSLETTDGVAILGYAGLGMTEGGTEPADWMSAVLRGRNLPLEQCLEALHAALVNQFPEHLAGLPGKFEASHTILVAAFLKEAPKIYTLDLAVDRATAVCKTRLASYIGPKPAASLRPPRVMSAGSGSTHVHRDAKSFRTLLKLVRECDRKRIDPVLVADYLAGMNQRVSASDKSVGARSIVMWRHRKQGAYGGGGSQQYYNGINREIDSPVLPSICNGMDSAAVIAAIWPLSMAFLEARMAGDGPSEIDADAMSAAVARVPTRPDETLK